MRSADGDESNSAINRRTVVAAAGAALMAPRSAAARTPAEERPLYFPRGCRLGIRVPAGFYGDDRILNAQTCRLMFGEPLVAERDHNEDVWNCDHRDMALLNERRISETEDRRLFEWTRQAGDPNHSLRTLVVRVSDAAGEADWFGQLDITTEALGYATAEPSPWRGERERWQADIDAILASVTIRPALSVEEMLREHRMSMDLTGLHPHHFGNQLVISIAPPPTRGDRWVNDAYIQMSNAPLPFVGEDASRRRKEKAVAQGWKSFQLTDGPASEWSANGMIWFAGSQRVLTDTLFVRTMEGWGGNRVVKLVAFSRHADHSALDAALERVARSTRLDP